MSDGGALAPSGQREPLSGPEFDELRSRIAATLGIDYPPHRLDTLASRVASRLGAHGMSSYADYCAHLRRRPADDEEWDHLAELLTNSETYFFREPGQLDQAATLVSELGGPREEPIRALSAGCSSGEEAYTLAMVLASRTLVSKHFEVHGVDVTPTRLAQAREGRYSLRSLSRGAPPPSGIRVEHFGATQGDHWQLHGWLRERVHFHKRNLVDPRGLRLGQFDLVFCRNVLIYAHPDRVSAFLRSLYDALRPGGHLFLGSSETLMGTDVPLDVVRLGDYFTYVRRDEDPRTDRR